MIRRVLLLGAALAAALSTVTHWAVLLIAIALYSSTVVMARRSLTARRSGDADQAGAAIVISVATGIVVVHAGADATSLWIVAILLAALHGLHLVRHVLRVLVFRRWRTATDWRNLTVAAPVPIRVLPVAGPTLVAIPLWTLAPVCAAFDADPIVYVLIGIVCLALVVLTVIPTCRALLHNLRMPADRARLDAVTAALRARSPEILVHFNARARSAYAINEWMTSLTALNRTHRVVILTVDRQPWHFETIEGDAIPIVHLAGAEAIEYFVEQVPSLTIALYPRSTSANKNLLRVPGLYDVLIGHGESDKAEAVNPAARAFDEVWIAGEAARSRFIAGNIGIEPDQLRITGRPQLVELLALGAATASAPSQSVPSRSVVYAPTWEGYYAEDGYGSVELLGEHVIDALLDHNDVHVTYLPHPALGTLNRRFAQASDRIVSRLRREGHSSLVGGTPAERYAVLAGAHVLVSDISSDLVDFLALDRPYVALNVSGANDDAFRAANPSVSAGIVLGPGTIGTLREVVHRALDRAEDATSRPELARRYLGDLTTSPLDHWLTEVDRCLDLVHRTRAARSLPMPEQVDE
jgi:CDP-Glycerol:Poly(glycerophosphate) glycerophosphotransferase